jgi:hypothetical protein
VTKKILLTVGAFPVALVLSFIVNLIIFTSIAAHVSSREEGRAFYQLAGTSSMWLSILFIILVAALVYAIWENVWKTVFILFLPLIFLAIIRELVNIQQWRIVDLFSDVGIVIAMIGLFSYSFKKKVFSQKFWKGFFLFYLLFMLYEFFIHIIPQRILTLPSYAIGYNTKVNSQYYPDFGSLLFILLLTLPLLYAAYRLGYTKKR